MTDRIRLPLLVGVLFLTTMSIVPRAVAQHPWRSLSRVDLCVGLTGYNTTASGHEPGIDYSSHNGYAHYGLMVDANLPLEEFAGQFSIGLSPGVVAGISPASQTDWGDAPQSADLSLPWFATLKYNNDATWRGETGVQIGATAGLGYDYHLFWAWGGYDESHTFGNPCWMAEINVGEHHSGIGLLKIRYLAPIGAGYRAVTTAHSQTIDQAGGIYVGLTLNY